MVVPETARGPVQILSPGHESLNLMGSEQALWKMTRGKLSPFGVLKRVENSLDSGTPDFSYCLRFPIYSRIHHSGWMELKHADAWPTRTSTPLDLPHLTREQIAWCKSWSQAGGSVFLLLQVANEYMLFRSTHMATVQAGCTRDRLRELAASCAYGFDRFPTSEIMRRLCEK